MRVGVLTVSDRSAQGIREDASGPLLCEQLQERGWTVDKYDIVPDDENMVARVLREWCDDMELDLILTTGGTGFGRRDCTPEATLKVLSRQAPGLAEAMRRASMDITPHAMLSRAVAGIRRNTLIINLPGSPKGALENLQVVLPALPHAVQLLQDDPRSELDHHKTSQA